MRAAVFSDVEGTLVDTSLPRLSLRVGRQLGIFSRWKMAELGALGLASRVAPTSAGKSLRLLIIKRAMSGRTVEEVERLSTAVAPVALDKVKQGTLNRLRRHQSEGLPLVLMSAGLHQVIEKIAGELGARGEGTRFLLRGERYLPRFDGPVCEGSGKAARARKVMEEMGYDAAASYGYGDTASDIPFLELFGHAYVVDPAPELEAQAKTRGWEVLWKG